MTARTIRFECFYFHQKICIFRKVTADLLPLAVQSDAKFSKIVFEKKHKTPKNYRKLYLKTMKL